jgi:hypothetical protein
MPRKCTAPWGFVGTNPTDKPMTCGLPVIQAACKQAGGPGRQSREISILKPLRALRPAVGLPQNIFSAALQCRFSTK